MRIRSTSSPETIEIISRFLQTRHSGALATVDTSTRPHAAVVYFTYNNDYTFSFVTKTQTQKYKNIKENKNVALVIYDEQEQVSVQVTGQMEIVTNEDEVQRLLNQSFMHSAEISGREFPPLEKLFAGDYVALRLMPHEIKMAVFARPESGADEMYEIIRLGRN